MSELASHYVTRAPGVDTHSITDLHGATIEVAGFHGTDINSAVVVIGDEHHTHALSPVAAASLATALIGALCDATPQGDHS